MMILLSLRAKTKVKTKVSPGDTSPQGLEYE